MLYHFHMSVVASPFTSINGDIFNISPVCGVAKHVTMLDSCLNFAIKRKNGQNCMRNKLLILAYEKILLLLVSAQYILTEVNEAEAPGGRYCVHLAVLAEGTDKEFWQIITELQRNTEKE